jgi:hypothetical protein
MLDREQERPIGEKHSDRSAGKWQLEAPGLGFLYRQRLEIS